MEASVSADAWANSNILSDVGDILTGGLRGAIDVELARQRAKIDTGALGEDNQLHVRGDSGASVPKGTAASPIASGVSPLWIVAGVALVAVVVVLAVRS